MQCTLPVGTGFALLCALTACSENKGVLGASCVQNAQCNDTLICNNGLCAGIESIPEGGACSLTLACESDLYCSQALTCKPAGSGVAGDSCENNAECGRDLLCFPDGLALTCQATGSADIGESCASTLDCLAGIECAQNTRGEGSCVPLRGFPDDFPELPTFPRWLGAVCPEEATEATAYFDLEAGKDGTTDFYRAPFPNDARLTADGSVDLEGHPRPGSVLSNDPVGRFIDNLAEDVRGFSTNPVAFFRFSTPVNADSLVAGGSVRFIDLATGEALPGFDIASEIPSVYTCPNTIGIGTRVGEPLQPNRSYAVILTRAVKAEGELDYTRSPQLDRLLAPAAQEGDFAAPHAAFADLRNWLNATEELDASEVLNATVFTTQDTLAATDRLIETVRSLPRPTTKDLVLCDEGVTSPCENAGGEGRRRCVVSSSDADLIEIQGRIVLPRFQAGTLPYLRAEDGGAISASQPVAQEGGAEVCFSLTLPKGVATEDLPLVIYGHGTGGANTSPVELGVSRDLAKGLGSVQVATLGIDLPQHGDRRGGSSEEPDTLFFNYANPRAARDNILQGSADLLAALAWARDMSWGASESPTGEAVNFDATRIAAYTHSQGSSHLQAVLSQIAYDNTDPGFQAIVLSGGGGDLVQSILAKKEPVDIATVAPLLILDLPDAFPPPLPFEMPAGRFNPALALIQTFYDRTDGVNFARHIHLEPREAKAQPDVFMSYGIGDTFTPDATLQAFAWAGQLPQVGEVFAPIPELVIPGESVLPTAPLGVSGNFDGGELTAGVRQYEPDGADGHFVAVSAGTTGRADAARFLLEALGGSAPSIGAP